LGWRFYYFDFFPGAIDMVLHSGRGLGHVEGDAEGFAGMVVPRTVGKALLRQLWFMRLNRFD
jgi:hypothetical protein